VKEAPTKASRRRWWLKNGGDIISEPKKALKLDATKTTAHSRLEQQEEKMSKAIGLLFASLLFLLGAVSGFAQVLCPDGSYVDRGPCRLCPDGSYIGGGGGCRLAPDGSFVRERGRSSPQLAPDGSYVSGGGKIILCPDGTYVSGRRCVLAPNGTYVGKD
jgi:hypothetical protein